MAYIAVSVNFTLFWILLWYLSERLQCKWAEGPYFGMTVAWAFPLIFGISITAFLLLLTIAGFIILSPALLFLYLLC